MANVAQLVNCLQSLFLAHGERFVATPTFHVFELYGAHAGGQAVRTLCSAPPISYDRVNAKGSFPGLAGSASLRERTLTLTLVNPHVREPRDVELGIRGATATSATMATIAASDIHDHNTFEAPDVVRPRAAAAPAIRGGSAVLRLPPASVTE